MSRGGPAAPECPERWGDWGAISGPPMFSEREGAVCRLFGEPFLLDPPLDPVPCHRVEMIDEEDPVQVIHLVLQHARPQTAGLDDEVLSIHVPRLDSDPFRSA